MENIFRKAFYHNLEEVNLLNIYESIKKSDYEKLRKVHDSIHEFIFLAALCLPSKEEVSWHSKSAFLTYHWEAFHLAHRSFLQALEGYYNAGYVLLRSTLELLLKGAFWECLAHRKFRKKANIIKKNATIKIQGFKRCLIDFIEEMFKRKPSIEEELEKVSGAIFDKIAPILEDTTLKRLEPRINVIVEQLAEWGIFNPISDSANYVYSIYKDLSIDVHVFPDRIDIGRRLLQGKDLFEVTVVLEELNKFLKTLHEVMDIGVIIELNILNDWIKGFEEVKCKLRKRLPVIKDLELNCSYLKLENLVKK